MPFHFCEAKLHPRFIRRFLILFSTLFFLVAGLQAQPTAPTPGKLLLALEKLHTTGSVLYIAAHPDDENTRLLAWLANERHLRTGYLSLTRGDGGQNLIGKEQGPMLGLLRTQELLAARRTDGAEQFFTRAYDFGYTKSPEETFRFWNHDSVLSDVVRIIRQFRPDVIICRFPTTGEGGHGHHTASAILAQEAFEAAADPKRFPEQLRHWSTWQARRLFWNTFRFGSVNTTSENQLKLDVGGYNPLLGASYGELAAESRSNHKSQGFGTARSRGEAIEYFKQLRGDTARKDLFEGINQSWSRMPQAANLGPLTAALIQHFNPLKPEASVPRLVGVYKAIAALPESNPNLRYWKALKLKEARSLIVAASGLWVEAAAKDYVAIPGRPISFDVQVLSRLGGNIRLQSIHWLPGGGDSTLNIGLGIDTLYTFQHTQKLEEETPYSNPYWLQEQHTKGLYVVKDPLMIGKPENDYFPKVSLELNIAGLQLNIDRRVVYKSTDPVKGEVYRPLEVLPPVTLKPSDELLIFDDSVAQKLSVTVTAHTDDLSGSLVLPQLPGWKVDVAHPGFQLSRKGDEAVIYLTISRTRGAAGKLQLAVDVAGKTYNKSIRSLEYDHVPFQMMLSNTEVTLMPIDLKKRGREIGYIPGAGDEVPACLSRIGYQVTTLSDALLAAGNLNRFDAIVTGVRAYNVNENLPNYHQQLMDYVQQGGNLIVQYNTNTRLGPMTAEPGPYPFSISRDRVTDEEAPVRFVHPEQAALNVPNKITQQDFEGWVQERGTYFATEIDKHYQTVLSMNDPGEAANEGSLIIAPYGKGNFVYTGLVFFRELPAGVPGAYRLFVNLLSLPKHLPAHEKN
ncbi:MAG: PIG-L family deacetylase [Bacteroidetes bacterium]|nr:PIG-L family deacetylase [Bacteroidota bacterium]